MPNKTTTHFSARKRLIVVAISACFVTAPAWSNPTGPQVVNGSANFNQAGKLLTVTNSSGAIINWNTFSIGANETTRFNQSSASSSVLNRVLANDPSVLLGTLSSNGRVWLVNPAGIMVGQGARIDVAGFIASTLNVRNEDFLAGRLNFGATQNAGKIENHGQITTPSGGSVYLIAPAVENHGIINAPNGEVILAAGQTVQLIDTGTPGVKVDITGAEGNVTNLGQIVAEAGRIGMAGVLVTNSGSLNVSSVVREGGRVFLKASQDAYVDGNGRILTTGTKGGSIEVLGNNVTVAEQAVMDSSGDEQGGGHILLKADMNLGLTSVAGSLRAKGGAQGGDGGFIETSGAHVKIADSARVNTSAPHGQAGTWLIDPTDYTIAASGGDISGTQLSTNLGLTSVTILSSSGATERNGDIFVNDAVAWSSANSLTLNALRNIGVNSPITNGLAGAINFNATGDVVISAGLNAHTITASGRNIAIPITGSITAGTTASLTATAGSISLNDSATPISAQTLNLNAVTGVYGSSSATALRTSNPGGATTINASNSGLGPVRVSDASFGGLVIGSSGVVQSGTGQLISIDSTPTNSGGLSILGPVTSSSGDISLSSAGSVNISGNVTASGAINIAATAGDLTQTTGSISNVTAPESSPGVSLSGSNITLRGVQSHGTVALNSTGTVNLLAVGSGGFLDDTFFSFNLPFTFNYFGTNYTQAFITTNGLVTFGSSTSEFSDSSAGLASFKAIAPAWNDWVLQANAGKDIHIAASASNLSVVWDVSRFGFAVNSAAPAAKFESVLRPDGTIRFNYGAANNSFAIDLSESGNPHDVTIGISNGSSINLISQLMNEPNFSLNNLRSTTFTPNVAGSYTETLSATNTPLSAFGTISGSALLGQGTGQVVSTTGALNISAGGVINAPSQLSAGTLQFQSHGGASFTGNNIFGSVGSSRNFQGNSASNPIADIVLYNNGAELTLNGLVNEQGGITVNNTGGIVVAGTVNASGALALAAQGGSISQSAALVAAALTTSAAGGTTLNAANAVGSFTALDTDAVSLTNTAATLALGPTTAASLTVKNAGEIDISPSGFVHASGAGNAIVLNASTGFKNNASVGATALSTGAGGRWLIYSASPSGVTKNGLASDFRHYNATFGSYGPDSVTESGNGFIYASAAGNVTVTTNLASGAASNTYGVAPTASFGFTLAGFVDSEDSAANIGLAGTATFTPTLATKTNAGSYTVAYANGLTSSAGYGFLAGPGVGYTVNPASLTLSAVTDTKVYDGTTASRLTPTITGLVSGDTVTGLSQSFGSPLALGVGASTLLVDVGNGKNVVNDANGGNNYIVTTQATNGTITPAPLTVSVTDQVLSTVVAITQQQPMQTTIQTQPPPLTTAFGGSGSLLLSNSTQTIGGTKGTFGGSNEDDQDVKKQADRPTAKKLATCSG